MGIFSIFKKKPVDVSPIICKCKRISENTIVEAIKKGADTVDKVREATGAATGSCGGRRCKPEIERLILEKK